MSHQTTPKPCKNLAKRQSECLRRRLNHFEAENNALVPIDLIELDKEEEILDAKQDFEPGSTQDYDLLFGKDLTQRPTLGNIPNIDQNRGQNDKPEPKHGNDFEQVASPTISLSPDQGIEPGLTQDYNLLLNNDQFQETATFSSTVTNTS